MSVNSKFFYGMLKTAVKIFCLLSSFLLYTKATELQLGPNKDCIIITLLNHNDTGSSRVHLICIFICQYADQNLFDNQVMFSMSKIHAETLDYEQILETTFRQGLNSRLKIQLPYIFRYR